MVGLIFFVFVKRRNKKIKIKNVENIDIAIANNNVHIKLKEMKDLHYSSAAASFQNLSNLPYKEI